MKKKSLTIFIKLTLAAIFVLMLAGCTIGCPRQNPWHENSPKDIWGITSMTRWDSDVVVYKLEWSMSQGHVREVNSFDIHIYRRNAENEWFIFHETNVSRSQVYQWTECCGGPSVFGYNVGNIEFVNATYRFFIRSINGDRTSVWSVNIISIPENLRE